MAQFAAFDPAVEVNGETVLSIVNGMGSFKNMAIKVLADNGITEAKAGSWYPQQSWLNAFKSISGTVGGTTLFNIGKAIPESAKFPPDINSIEKALAAIDVAYHMNHRIRGEALFNPSTGIMKEGIGHYGFKKESDKKIVMVCNNPYPCDFDRGIIQAMASKFKPAGAIISAVHDDSQPCRKKGADSCTYTVTW